METDSRGRECMNRRHIALIPAAGVGARFGAGKPKQYIRIHGKTVLEHTVAIFTQHPLIDLAAIVVSPDDPFINHLQMTSDKTVIFNVGGNTRAETVRNGVQTLIEKKLADNHDNILVHDAARCCLPHDALSRLIQEAGTKAEGGILAIPAADTIKRSDTDGQILETVPRTDLWQAQTPQLFQAGLLNRALSASDLNGITDEASAVEQLGIRPLLVQGDIRNLKLTLPQDEFIIRLLLNT